MRCVTRLIKDGFDVNGQDKEGYTPLHMAVRHSKRGTLTIVEQLLTNGANPNMKTRDGFTVLHGLTFGLDIYNRFRILKVLLKYGADPNIKSASGYTPLHCVDNIEMIEELIKYGADPNSQTYDGTTPLHCAMTSRHFSRIELLLNYSNTDLRDSNGIRAIDMEANPSVRKMIESYMFPDVKEPDINENL
jgi:ankyrin repeat protein